ncbi:cbb3-type cytochrome c oxidase subunit I [bacterium]|nr:cbb3-type cytochrome c oxidase subunit I [bacterium]
MAESTSIADPNDVDLRASIDRSLRHPVMFFFSMGAVWLAVAIILGLVASAKKHSPEFLGGFSLLDAGKVDGAHMSALIYGWGAQAAFGMIIWLMSRLSRKECTSVGLILLAGHIWNFAVGFGVIAILVGQGSGVPYMEFPLPIWPILILCYLGITVWSLIQFQVRDAGHVYVSQWYLLAGLLWFPWLAVTAFLFVFVFNGNPLMAAAIAAWYKGGLFLLFFVPTALASAYYLAPKVTGRPVYSYNLALFGFWALAFIGPWAGFQRLFGAPIPQFLPYAGAAAMVLILIPALAVGINILKTLVGHSEIVAESPSLRFTSAGIILFVVYGVLSLLLHTVGSMKITQFSYSGYGFDILGLYGVFSLCAFGAIYFIVPRIMRREWLSRRFIKWHFYLSLYGVASIVICAVVGGITQGQGIEDISQPFGTMAERASQYGWGVTLAWGFLLFANLFFCLHLLLMWARLGRRSSHPTLLTGHHAESPHGPEGEIDNIGSASA